jgi:dTDP-4-amino-4,6-dideoxygalactose transaminase
LKRSIRDLAILGGPPAFEESLHVGRPNVGDRQRLLARLNDSLDRRWLTNNGPYVQEFERRLAETVGVKHCIAVCNATVALEIVIMALGLTGEVVVPAFTFIATAHALQWQGIKPVFCDVDPRTHNLSPAQVERVVTPHTTGVIGVHLWGRPCEVEALTDIANAFNLKLIFDAAHAFACTYRGRMIGGFGDAEVFSFHATKVLNAFEGGAVATNNDELAAKVRSMRNFGFAGYDEVIDLGTNGKMNEASAAMGLTSLESLKKFIAINRSNYEQYLHQLQGVTGIQLLAYDASEECNYQYVVIEIGEAAHISRDELQEVLWAENILARRYFYPGCHRMEPYSLRSPMILRLPGTEFLVTRVLSLPTGTAVGHREISRICKIIRLAVAHGERIRQAVSVSRQER